MSSWWNFPLPAGATIPIFAYLLLFAVHGDQEAKDFMEKIEVVIYVRL